MRGRSSGEWRGVKERDEGLERVSGMRKRSKVSGVSALTRLGQSTSGACGANQYMASMMEEKIRRVGKLGAGKQHAMRRGNTYGKTLLLILMMEPHNVGPPNNTETARPSITNSTISFWV